MTLLEGAVARSVTLPSQLQTLASLLVDEAYTGSASFYPPGELDGARARLYVGPERAMSSVAAFRVLFPGALDTARSRIMGRAQSNLLWLAAHKQPICSFLAAESAALAAGSGSGR